MMLGTSIFSRPQKNEHRALDVSKQKIKACCQPPTDTWTESLFTERATTYGRSSNKLIIERKHTALQNKVKLNVSHQAEFTE